MPGKVSHPMRVRGLKLGEHSKLIHLCLVAPHAGAWIETSRLHLLQRHKVSHPMRVRGLKPKYLRNRVYDICRTPCGCVD